MGGLISHFQGFLGNRELRFLILGLDGAGKTTILYRLKIGEVVFAVPTTGINVEQVTYKNLKFQAWDFSGQSRIRPLRRHYYSNKDAVIYVVDSADKDRIGECKEELFRVLSADELDSAVLLVLANKQDIDGCMSLSEVYQALGLDTLRNRTFQIFKTSTKNENGLNEAMDWLSNTLRNCK